MKRAVFLLLVLLVYSSSLHAHPAGKIAVNFNKETKILTVEVFHSVKNKENHFIKEIKIYIGKELFVTQAFKSQLTGETQKAVYLLADVGPDSEITVETRCSVFGKKKDTFITKGYLTGGAEK
jgi:desulfoferrodoxin (superoxide reductase-like protein)